MVREKLSKDLGTPPSATVPSSIPERVEEMEMHDRADEVCVYWVVDEADVVGFYPADAAAGASRATACDPGSGPVRIDD
jgi:hypothetical protein